MKQVKIGEDFGLRYGFLACLTVVLFSFSCDPSQEIIDEVCDSIVGKRFESRDEQVCWGTPIIYCHWCISFDESTFEWMPGDAGRYGDYKCENGVIEEVSDYNGYAGEYDPDSETLTWDRVIYLLSDAQFDCIGF